MPEQRPEQQSEEASSNTESGAIIETNLSLTERDQSQDNPVQTISSPERPVEHGGPKGPEPTRYGDWEKNGRCIDF